MQSNRKRVKITNVEVIVLKSLGLYNNPEGSEEPLGPTYMGIVRVSTDAGIIGCSDMETAASVAKAAVEARCIREIQHLAGPLSRAMVKTSLQMADGYVPVPG